MARKWLVSMSVLMLTLSAYAVEPLLSDGSVDLEGEMLVTSDNSICFRNGGNCICSNDTDILSLHAAHAIEALVSIPAGGYSVACVMRLNRITIGADNSGDKTLVFDGSPNDGIITWSSTDDTFHFNAKVRYTRSVSRFKSGDNEFATAGTGTINNQPYLSFDKSTNENAIFSGIMFQEYGAGDITATLHWRSAFLSGYVKWDVEFERIGTTQNTNSDGFAAVRTKTTTTSSPTGNLSNTTITFTNTQADGILPGEGFRLRVTRDASDSGDNLFADALLRFIDVQED